MSRSTHIDQIRADVDRGIAIRREIEALESEMELIEARLKEAGLNGDQVDLVDQDREGKQFLAIGSKLIVPVVFTADKLIGSFTDNSPKHMELVRAMAMHESRLKDFFTSKTTWESKISSGKKFRAHATEVLAQRAPTFITACVARDSAGIPKSDIKICWGDAKVNPEAN